MELLELDQEPIHRRGDGSNAGGGAEVVATVFDDFFQQVAVPALRVLAVVQSQELVGQLRVLLALFLDARETGVTQLLATLAVPLWRRWAVVVLVLIAPFVLPVGWATNLVRRGYAQHVV